MGVGIEECDSVLVLPLIKHKALELLDYTIKQSL